METGGYDCESEEDELEEKEEEVVPEKKILQRNVNLRLKA